MSEDWSIDDLNNKPTGEYSPFHPGLDDKYPVGKLIGPTVMEFINSDDGDSRKRLSWVSIFRNSPAGKSESEHIMGNFIEAAGRAGQWVDVPVKSDEPLAKRPTVDLPDGNVVDFSNIILQYGAGTDKLVEKGLAKRTTDDGGEWLSPTEEFAKFVDERFGKYGLKAE